MDNSKKSHVKKDRACNVRKDDSKKGKETLLTLDYDRGVEELSTKEEGDKYEMLKNKKIERIRKVRTWQRVLFDVDLHLKNNGFYST